jgi:hypothetical protein
VCLEGGKEAGLRSPRLELLCSELHACLIGLACRVAERLHQHRRCRAHRVLRLAALFLAAAEPNWELSRVSSGISAEELLISLHGSGFIWLAYKSKAAACFLVSLKVGTSLLAESSSVLFLPSS